MEITYTKEDLYLMQIFGKLFTREQKTVEQIVDNWFERTNNSLIQQVISYMEVCISQKVFKEVFHINTQFLDLGTAYNDHQTILKAFSTSLVLQMPEFKHFIIEKKDFEKGIVNLMHKLKEFISVGTNLCIMIDRFEVIELQTFSHLVKLIYDEINPSSMTDVQSIDYNVFLLLCCSSESKCLTAVISPEAYLYLNLSKTRISIEKFEISSLQEDLVNSANLNMKLDTRIVRFIEEYVDFLDTSVASLKYLINVCLFNHYKNPKTIFNQSKEEITELFKTNKKLVVDILKGVKDFNIKKLDGNWNNNQKLIEQLTNQIETTKNYSIYLEYQAQLLYGLLKNLRRLPATVNDIVYELIDLQTLSQSEIYEDAIFALLAMNPIKVHDRLKKTLNSIGIKKIGSSDYYPDVRKIFTKFDERFENNPESKKTLTELCAELREYGLQTINPRKMPMYSVVYFSDIDILRLKCCYSMRDNLLPQFLNKKYDFGMIYSLIHESDFEVINKEELFLEYLEEKNKRLKAEKKKTIHEDNGPWRGYFCKLLEDMETHGLIILQTQNLIKKIAWL